MLSPKDIVTTKDILTAIRIGQNEFRNKLLSSLKKCPVTNIDDPRILTASHIKPWTMANNKERLDIFNGFIFSPTIDKLFDRGIITFTDDKLLIVSRTFSIKNAERLGLRSNQFIPDLPIRGRQNYLDYHRTKIFLHK